MSNLHNVKPEPRCPLGGACSASELWGRVFREVVA